MQRQRLSFGVDVFLEQFDKFKSFRFALATNDAATTSAGRLSRVELVKKGFRLNKLFSPEHGLTAKGEDGRSQSNSTDPITGLPVISLYGEHLKPSEEDLADVDAVLFDIPDVGCRFYTYLWTLTYIMEACAGTGKPLFVLDRPNPLSGNFDLIEGPMLDEIHCSSFIGRWTMPVRHSCTLGELAGHFRATRVNNLKLEIIRLQNFERNQLAQQADWPFIPPSPAMADKETALLYPGTGLLEGINVNEGRGTHYPFKIFGAPWINASHLHQAFQRFNFSGIRSEPLAYKPTSCLYAGEVCYGLKLKVTDVLSFHPVQTGLKLIELIASNYPGHCRERLYSTTANPKGVAHLDKLTGVAGSFEKIKNSQMPDQSLMISNWKESLEPHLLYK